MARLFRKTLRPMALTLLFSLAVVIGPSAGVAQANVDYCYAWNGLNTRPAVQPVPNYQCVRWDTERGQRAEVMFVPYEDYQSVGRFMLTLTREGKQVTKSKVYINPLFPGDQPYYRIRTPWVDKASGKFCAKLWDEDRYPGDWYVVETYCHTMP